MQFSDTSTKTGIIQDCENLVFNEYGRISGNTNLLQTFTNYINRQYDKAVSVIIENDNRWQYDDTSYTTQAVYTTNLVANQKNYVLDATHLKTTMVRIKDDAGAWRILMPIDQNDPIGRAYLNEPSTPSTGDPYWYDKRGDLIILYPEPDYSLANALEITVQRQPNYFVYTDTTKEAGLAPLFHRYLSLGAAMEYAIANGLSNKNDLAQLHQMEEERMTRFYSSRSRDEQKVLRAKLVNSR